jgi:hypothetical protein
MKKAVVLVALAISLTVVAVAPATAATPTSNAGRALAIAHQIEQLANRGIRIIRTHPYSTCSIIPAERAIVNRIDTLVWQLRVLGYPNPKLERLGTSMRKTIAQMTALCR